MRLNGDVALKRDIYLSAEQVGARVEQFPLVAALLGNRSAEVLRGDRKRYDAAPLLLRLLEQDGARSAAMLTRLEAGLQRFDEVEPAGWAVWKAGLPGADRQTGLSKYSELLLALTFDAWGQPVLAFDPAGATGKLADLAVEIVGEKILVETSSPGPHEEDWIDRAMDHLTLALSRVMSGLAIDVNGYDSLRLIDAGEWEHDRQVSTQEVEDLVNEFCRRAEGIDTSALPQIVIEPSDGQPVTITVTAADEASDRTAVVSSWGRSGLVPNVQRLARKILAERHHLPSYARCLVLIDLRMWPDFHHADHYLDKVAEELSGHDLPAAVGTFISDNHRLTLSRKLLHIDESWRSSAAGECFESTWTAA